MNDKRIKHIGLTALTTTLLLSSCAQEEPIARDTMADDSAILFLTSLPGVETRSNDNIDLDRIKQKGFDVAASCMDKVSPEGDTIPELHFRAQLVKQSPGMGEAYRSDSCRWPSNKGDKEGRLRFSAFFPSREHLKEAAGVSANDTTCFKLEYSENEKGTIEYRMNGFKINKDITKHSDFVTATAQGSKTDNLYSGVNLQFQHHLSGIYFQAYGKPTEYEVEIAGVRIGGIAMESDFSFQGESNNLNDQNRGWRLTKVGRWIDISKAKGCVEYVFQEGDTVVGIGKGKYEKRETAANIMGRSGCALVIPLDYPVWTNFRTYPNTDLINQKLYFSVLLRVKDKVTEEKPLLYPYIEGADMDSEHDTNYKKNVVYLAVDNKTGIVRKRLYRNPEDKKYYTDEDYKELYEQISGASIRNYGWASCIPTNGSIQRWNPGCQYIYQLDYSTGIGVGDPESAFPGKPIISPIEVTGTEKPYWHSVSDYEKTDVNITDKNYTIE